VVTTGATVVVGICSRITSLGNCWYDIDTVGTPRCEYNKRITGCRDTAMTPPAIATNSKVNVLVPVGTFSDFLFGILSTKE
jgi:hypothetical protein